MNESCFCKSQNTVITAAFYIKPPTKILKKSVCANNKYITLQYSPQSPSNRVRRGGSGRLGADRLQVPEATQAAGPGTNHEEAAGDGAARATGAGAGERPG